MIHEADILHVLWLVAIIVEAMSAALVAGRREMDWFGVCALASITALGGGTLRDVLLGRHPLTWIEHPEYLGVTIVAALTLAFAAPYMQRLRRLFMGLDAVGLVVFTVLGCDIAADMGMPVPIVLVAGMITGCGGGVLRDLLCGESPLLFRKELYASVSLLTGALYVGVQWSALPHAVALSVAMVSGLALRLLAIRYGWNMPHFIYRSKWD